MRRTSLAVGLGIWSLVVALLVSSACVPAAKKPEVSQVKAGIMVVENVSPLYAAEKLGYFKDEGLQVEQTTLGGGAEILPGIVAGKINFGYSNVVSVLQARSQGFDMSIISSSFAVPTSPPDVNSLMVKADSPFKSAQDLAGKRMAVNNINNLPWVLMRAWLKKNGVDPNTVTFREVPLPQTADAIANGQVEAGYMVPPFSTAALQQGKLKVLANPDMDFQPGMDFGVFAASEKWVKENPAATAAFVRAYSRATDLFNKDLAERKKYTAENTKIEPALMDKMTLGVLRVKIDAAALQKTADLMLEHGLLKEKMDVSKAIWDTAK
ncbi:MAG: ABC transporter substrate-binding protein [Chloroflexi bacterium]|nr:ABC transporter substrate-binding protein [Chloroflexota bacterium]